MAIGPTTNPYGGSNSNSSYSGDASAGPGFPLGPADRAGGLYDPGQSLNQNPDAQQGVQDDFAQFVATALWREGVDLNQVRGMYPQLLEALWQDNYIRGLYNAGFSLADTVDPSTGQITSDPYLTISNLETAITKELFDPNQTHSQFLVSEGITMLTLSGKQLTSQQQTYGANLGGGNPTILAAIAKAAQETGVPYNVALATAIAESGLDPTATGDNGCSHGLFQLNTCGGEGQGMTLDQMQDPYTNAKRALEQFAAVAAADPSVTSDPGKWAAEAQRPQDPTNYALRVNNLLQSGFGGSPSSLVPKPFDGSYPVTLDYGQSDPFGGTEQGIDYGMNQGTLLYTPFAGTIQVEDMGKGEWGKRVFVRLDNGYTFAIGHMHSFSVSDGQRVNPGDLLGESGGNANDPSSGDSTGDHIEVQWISPGGQYLNPHSIVDPILQGDATFRSLNLSGAEGSGVSVGSASDRTLGIDPLLEQKYPTAVSEFKKYFGRHPTATELQSLITHGTSQDALEAYLRTQPSHIPGMSIGMYEDVKGSLDSIMTNGAPGSGLPYGLGHAGTDGMVQELFQQGITSPTGIAFWIMQMDIEGKMNPATYQQLYQLNAPYQVGIYNDPGFDPRTAVAQYNQAQQQGVKFPPPGKTQGTPQANPQAMQNQQNQNQPAQTPDQGSSSGSSSLYSPQ